MARESGKCGICKEKFYGHVGFPIPNFYMEVFNAEDRSFRWASPVCDSCASPENNVLAKLEEFAMKLSEEEKLALWRKVFSRDAPTS